MPQHYPVGPFAFPMIPGLPDVIRLQYATNEFGIGCPLYEEIYLDNSTSTDVIGLALLFNIHPELTLDSDRNTSRAMGEQRNSKVGR